jgi:acetyl/propionyl-CoA carboxylase alpha subunit/acetyl-CoA carboxylase carboxyltransferase component
VFTRVAVINRGEAAMRLIHAVRELNAAGDQPRIQTIALYTEAEATAKFVRDADLSYPLGPAAARPYLDLAVLERALRETKADAAWVGWGFVAEQPEFAELCERLGVVFIGPSASAMRSLGDKIGSKLLAEQVGVPVAPWSQGPVPSKEDALAQAARLGYPLMLKASAGGGGRGIRRVNSDAELAAVFDQTSDEAARAFGSGVMFLESLVTGARHVEVQIIADGHGTAWAVGVRDCSIQRRNQKIIEESASPVLEPEQVREVKAAAERLAIAVGYCGAGTVEFLYQPQQRMFAFLEVNTRLQVEHPITELTTGLDLVKAQLHVAAGGKLDGDRPAELGHAVEARLNAEDPDRDFAPAPGRIQLLQLPTGPGVRVDTGFGTGDVIPGDFDSMIAKIIAFGADREEALARLRRAVADTVVVIEGGSTNKSFVLDLLNEPAVIDGSADTGWIDRTRAEGGLISHRHAGIALIAAAIDAYEVAETAERQHFLATAHGGRPQARHRPGRNIELKLRGAGYRLSVAQLGPRRFRIGLQDKEKFRRVDARIQRLDEHTSRLEVGGERFRVTSAAHGPVSLIEVDGTTHRVTRDEGGVLRSPAPALVVAVPVAVGDEVPAGAPVLVLESMKMETVLTAPFPARVRALLVSTGGQVETGTPLIRLEPTGEAAQEVPAATGVPELELPTEPELPVAVRAAAQLRDLRDLLLGFDLADPGQTLADYQDCRAQLAKSGQQPIEAELDLFTAFADLCELGRNRPAGEESVGERVHSPREYFHSYLHSLDLDREQLPNSFRERLRRALAHYEVFELERTPALEEAVYRIFLAQPGAPNPLHLMTSLLQQWTVDPLPVDTAAAYEVLDRLVSATQLRYPAVGDLARSVRFRWFERPLLEAERSQLLAGVPAEIDYLAANPQAADYASRLDRIVQIPERTVRFLAERIERGIEGHEPMLEVLARRHYAGYELHDLVSEVIDGRPYVTCDYTLDQRPSHLITTVARFAELVPGSALVRQLQAKLDQQPAGHQGVIDLYLLWPEIPDSPAEATALLQRRLDALGLIERVRRFAVATCPGSGRPVGYYTYRPAKDSSLPGPGGASVEDDLVRGVHPMVGRRLSLWRLRNFSITRLDAPEDVLLYHCVARGNDADQRLVALAQIRELAVVRDASGRVVSLPQAERAVASCGDAIRRARAALGAARLDMNIVSLHIWPVIDAPLDELTALQKTISPLTVGAGIESVQAEGRIVMPDGRVQQVAATFSFQPGAGVVFQVSRPSTERLQPLTDYDQKVQRARRRGNVYPYELTSMIAGRGGRFVEHDLDPAADSPRLVPVDRLPGGNQAGIVVGVASTPTERYPDGVRRVVLLGDPTRALGAVAEPECSRVIAALDLAESMGVPVEWFALSAGARISMDSGTENMDWVARALQRIVTFTQAGHEINVVVAGINVGAQPYWNAEATMLMHTRGILVMTPDSAMVLTGKQSLDFSGGVSAEDNFGIGGYDRVMGPNGQAQYWVPNLAAACDLLAEHYAFSYVAPGEAGPRPAHSEDPADRDVSTFPHEHPDSEFATIGEVFSAATNPDRKKAFDMRTLMHSVSDQDLPVRERWADMAEAETSVVFDAYLGGRPVCLIGIESRPIPRRGFPPSDGPDLWTAGTLFPRSSKKTARAINAASGNRPVVVLANLSGFDGSPDSMRNLQLEYGAEIGRAIVNFDGPIVFCVVSRYHGGAFVVFSKTLNPRMTVLAVEGSFASVIGGAPAAAVVFTGDVDKRTARDPRVQELEARIAGETDPVHRAALLTELSELRAGVRVEKLAQVAAEFDSVHSIRRAVEVGSVDAVIEAAELRPQLIAALDR